MARDGSDRVAEALREDEPVLDDIRRARMERDLLAAVRSRGAEPERLPASRRSPRQRQTLAIGFGVGVAVAAAVFLAFSAGSGPDGGARVAEVFVVEDGAVVPRGDLDAGQPIRTRGDQRVRVRIDDSAVEVAPSSEVALEQVTGDEVRIRVDRGVVDVEFHPRRPGEERMTVVTRSARVEVVGTVFRVAVDGDGTTNVSVSEGTVRVVPSHAGEARLVVAGGSTTVMMPRRADAARVVGSPALAGAPVVAVAPAADVAEGERPPAVEPVPTRAAPVAAPAHGRPTTARTERSARSARATRLEPVEEHGDAPEAPVVAPSDEELATADAEGAPEWEDGSWDPDRAGAVPWGVQVDRARKMLREGRVDAARSALARILRGSPPSSIQAEVLTLMAESWETVDHRQAQTFYERAANVEAGRVARYNAIYALARMHERRGAREEARLSYERYLREAPYGPHTQLARQALCRLGSRPHCGR